MNDFLQSLRNGQAEKQRSPKTRKSYDNSYHYSSGPRFQNYGGYPNTRAQQMKRQPASNMPQQQGGNQMPADDANITVLLDVVDNLTGHVETLVKNQEYMINIQERTAEIIERQAMAIERVINHLNLSPEMAPEAQGGPRTPFENHYMTSREPEESFEPEMEPDVREMQHMAPPARKPARKPVLRKRRKVAERSHAPQMQGDSHLMGRDDIMDLINTMRAEGATYDQVAKRLIDLGQPTFSGRGEWHAQTIHRLCAKK